MYGSGGKTEAHCSSEMERAREKRQGKSSCPKGRKAESTLIHQLNRFDLSTSLFGQSRGEIEAPSVKTREEVRKGFGEGADFIIS